MSLGAGRGSLDSGAMGLLGEDFTFRHAWTGLEGVGRSCFPAGEWSL